MSTTPTQQQQQTPPPVAQISQPPATSAPPAQPKESRVSIEEKLYLAKYKLDERPHLVVLDQDVCQRCAQINGSPQPCMILCPADVYKWEDGKRNVVSYDNCVECGGCRIICPYTNIEWKYPRWGRGLSLRYG